MTSQQRRVTFTGSDYFFGHELVHNLLRNHRSDLERTRIVLAGVHIERLRDLERQGAEVVQINLDDIKQLEEVFRNSDWAVVEPIPEHNRVETTRRILEAIKRANVKNVILVSNAGVENSDRYRHLQQFAEIERDLKNANFNHYTILRSEFPQNWFHAWAYPVEDKGHFPLSTGPDNRFAPIRIEDISNAVNDILRGEETSGVASVISHVLGSNRHNKQTYTLTGPEALNGQKIVDELNRAVQARVSYVDADRNQLERILRALRDREGQQRALRVQAGEEDEERRRFEGQPTDVQIQTILDYFDWVKAGNGDRTTDDLKRIIGRDGHRIEGFFRDHAAEFRPRRE